MRIALNLKSYEKLLVHLRRSEQSRPDYLGVNPQGWSRHSQTRAGTR